MLGTMARLLRVLLSLIPVIFGILAFVFSVLAITSRDWASRRQYADDTDAISQSAPIYTLYRSPFRICTETVTSNGSTSASNTTSSDDGDDQPPPTDLNYTYTSNCVHYPVYGFNRTSCELPSVANSNVLPQVGDQRQCQQIHLAGDYQIASTTFITLAFVLALAMAVWDCFGSARAHHRAAEGEREYEHPHHSRLSTIPSLLKLVMFPSAMVGAGAALLAQFYAVLGLIQSAPNNADFATSSGNREHHDPWVQGKALSLYMTQSWFWALLCGWTSWAIWGGIRNSHSGYGARHRERRHHGRHNGRGRKFWPGRKSKDEVVQIRSD